MKKKLEAQIAMAAEKGSEMKSDRSKAKKLDTVLENGDSREEGGDGVSEEYGKVPRDRRGRHRADELSDLSSIELNDSFDLTRNHHQDQP